MLLHMEQLKPDFIDDVATHAGIPAARRKPRIEIEEPAIKVKMLHVEHISPNPRQPRKHFDEGDLQLLAASIQKHGLIQPITVRKVPDNPSTPYELIAGERRLRAVQSLGEAEIPARVLEADNMYSATLALIENTHRADLNVIELAQAYQDMIEEYGWSQQQLSEHVSSTRQQVGHILSMLKLPDHTRSLLTADAITLGHAKVLVSLDSEDDINNLAQETVRQGLTVRELTDLVAAVKSKNQAGNGSKRPSRKSSKSHDWSEWSQKWEAALETSVKISGSRGNYNLAIRFSDAEDLARIFGSLQEQYR